ncbi:MAG: 7TM-DISM domain-containing protein [Pusillimonas sp.]
MRMVLALLLLALTLLTPVRAETNHIVTQHWFEDPTGQMTLAHVQAQDNLTPFDGLLAKGYGDSTLWVKLRIDPAITGAAPGDPLFLRIRPNYLDDLTLYDPAQGPDPIGPTGDRYPLDANPTDSTRFTFTLPAGSEARDVWVALKSTSTRLARFEVFDRKTLILSGAKLDLAGSLYLGLLGLFTLWGLMQLYLRPEPLMLCFVAYLTTAAIFGASMLGYSRLLLDGVFSPATLDRLTSLMGIVATAFALSFDYLLLNEINFSRWRRRVFLVLLAGFLIMLAQLLGGNVIAALKGNMVLILVTPVLLLIMALLSRPCADPAAPKKIPKSWVVAYAALTLVFTLLASAPSLGLIKAAEFSLYIVLFYSLTSGLLMLLMLAYRAHILFKHQQEQAAMALANAQRAEQERADRLDREKLLAMIGHELKTPMATLRMLTSHQTIPEQLSRRMDASVQEMAGVVDRVVQTGKLADQAALVSLQPCDLGNLITTLVQNLPDADRVSVEPLPPAAATPTGTQRRDTPPVETDPQLLSVILRNLVDNALKYSPPETPVTLQYAVEPECPEHWHIEVTNHPGRAGRPDPVNMFKKYYRSPLASYKTGSGLGLYIVQELARLLGANVVYVSDTELIRFRIEHPHREPSKEASS